MAKQTYKITNFQSGINTASDSRDIDDTHALEMTGLTASTAGKLKVHGGIDYYSITTEYTDVTGSAGTQSVLIPDASIQTDSDNTFIEHDGENDLGGGGLFYFSEDYDLSSLDPGEWDSIAASYYAKGVEYFLIHNAGMLKLINISHNDDGSQSAKNIPFDNINIIYDGIKGIYYYRNTLHAGSTIDGITYEGQKLVGLYTGALDGVWQKDNGDWCAGDIDKTPSSARFFQQGGLVRYINSQPQTLSRYGHGHSHYVGMIKHDGILNSIKYGETWDDEVLDGYQHPLKHGGTFVTGGSDPEYPTYAGIFKNWGRGGFIKRNNFFTGEAAPILRPRVYSVNEFGGRSTFMINCTGQPTHEDGSHTTNPPPENGDNLKLFTHLNNYYHLKKYPTRSRSVLTVWKGDKEVVDYNDSAPEMVGVFEFGMTSVYLDGQESNVVTGVRFIVDDNNEGKFIKQTINTDKWNASDTNTTEGSGDDEITVPPGRPIRFQIHLLGWPFLDSERIAKYRYYIKMNGTETWSNFAEADLTTGVLNTFGCIAESDNYESSQKLIPIVDNADIVTYRSSNWTIASMPEFSYEDYNGHNSSGSYVSTDISYADLDTTHITPNDDDYNGVSLNEENVKFWGAWKAAALYKNRVFYGNVTTPDGSEREDTMIASPVGQYDKMPFDGFHYENVATGDGDKIVHLASHGDYLFQFKRKSVYILNYDEDERLKVFQSYPGLGISHPCQVCETPYGLVWITGQGCHLFVNNSVENLIDNKIDYGKQYIPFPNDNNTEFSIDNTSQWYSSGNNNSIPNFWKAEEGTREWDAAAVDYIQHGWQGFFYPSIDVGIEISRPFIGYDANEDILIIGRSSNFQTDYLNKEKGASGFATFGGKNDAYMYSFKTRSWSFSKHLFTNFKNPNKELINNKMLTGASVFFNGYNHSVGRNYGRLAHTKTNPILTKDGRFAIGINQLGDDIEDLCKEGHLNVMAWNADSNKCSPYSRGMGCFITKDIDFGSPGVRKKVFKVYITYRYPNAKHAWTSNHGTPVSRPKVSFFANGNRAFPENNNEISESQALGYFGQNYFNGALSLSGIENASGGGYLTGHNDNDLKTAILEPATASDADNIYSFQLIVSADNDFGLRPGGYMKGFPPGFEISDITIIFREKTIK